MASAFDIDWETAFQRAYHAAFGVLDDAALAKDVAQDACVKALVGLASFEWRCAFPSWVRTIAFHLALDERRRRSRFDPSSAPGDLPGGGSPEGGVLSAKGRNALHECLSRLTEHQLRIFLAKHLDDMKGDEVAIEVGVAPGTVWATLSQVAKNLRQCLAGHGIDSGTLH